jgi:AcrR family transcriptional regulator
MPKVSQEYRDERRAHILAAARRCFVRDGFHQTSMQELVSEAGLSSGAVYRYFPSKDAMIEAIAEQNLEEVTAVLRDSLASGLSVGDAMSCVLRHVAARHAEDGFAAIAVLVWSEALRNPALAARLRESNEAAAQALSDKHPAGRQVPARAVADLLLCVLPGYLMQLAIRGPEAVDAIPATVEALFPSKAAPKSKRRHANQGP